VLSGHEVVLAAPPDVVAAVLEDLEQAGVIGLEHVQQGAVATDVRVPAGHKGAAAGGADGILAEGPTEGDGVSRDGGVEVGGESGGVAEVAEDVAAPLVRIEDHDVGRVGHGVERLAPKEARFD